MNSAVTDMLHTAETLLTAAAGALIFQILGLPGGLVSGSMLAVAVAALAGRPVRVPLPLARVCFVLIGMLLGAVVTPETLHGIASWPLSVALLIASSTIMFIGTACYLRWVHGWDALSALLGASPGSMAQVMALSAELHADIRGVAIVHVMRVLLIVVGLPSGRRCSDQRSGRLVSCGAGRSPPSLSSPFSSSSPRRSRCSCCASGFPGD